MTGRELRQAYLDFFIGKNHSRIDPAPLVLENDPTTLFTSSGMQPLVPYLLGAPHPAGTRLVNSQPSFRSQDIDEVGDNRHSTFFEMLGNWSLGDYFKQDQLTWFFTFLTDTIGLDPNKLYVSVFAGNDQVPRDDESIRIWQQLFTSKNIDAKLGERIFAYPADKNWWSRAGIPESMPAGEPGGPDSEVFFDFGADLKLHENSPFKDSTCHPNCDCGRFLEIGNSVFMQYQKSAAGSLQELPQKNVDFGGGLERLLAATQNSPDIFTTDLFLPLIRQIEALTERSYTDRHQAPMRVIADHLKASVFLISSGVLPGNKQQPYLLRRLLRRSAVKLHQLTGRSLNGGVLTELAQTVVSIYPEYLDSKTLTPKLDLITEEINKFNKALDKGLRLLDKSTPESITPQFAFDLLQTYGFPYEVTKEIALTKGVTLDDAAFDALKSQHTQLSRTTSAGMFKGGLQDQSEITTKYHTATHLLHQALRQILGPSVQQVGSNITADRLRFDFTHPQPLTPDQLQQVEALVNQQINADLPVTRDEMSLEQARDSGALAFFTHKYADTVSVYSIGDFSREVCGGPHVAHTAVIGPITLYKQEAVGQGRRRLYAKLR